MPEPAGFFDKDKKVPEEKEKKYINEVDVDVVVGLLLNILAKVDVNKQKGQNVVLTNGNNNEVQIPNEEGPGSNVQV